jgi:ABC-type transport system substrate-binding protein
MTRSIAALLALALALAACSGAGPSPSVTPAASPSPAGPEQTGTTPTEPPASVDEPSEPIDGPGPGDGTGGARLVEPEPGQGRVRSVGVETLRSRIEEDGRLIVTAEWWSGVEPCHVLDSVLAERDGSTVTLTVREGDGGEPGTMCIQIAVLKATEIDLGVPAPGAYVVRADADSTAEPLAITID